MNHITQYHQFFPENFQFWKISDEVCDLIINKIKNLSEEFIINGNIAIHKSAKIHETAQISGPVIISENCFVGAYSTIRRGVYLSENVVIGTNCEIKSSVIFADSAVAHFNFIGDSIIGSYVNFEAGSITANHFNEREDKEISIKFEDEIIMTGVEKFGSLVGDFCKIGANAVLSPGTFLPKNSVVKRLELIEQIK